MNVYEDIRVERMNVEPRPFVNAHDYVRRAEAQAHADNPVNPGYYCRNNLIKAAALLVAAIEVLDKADDDD